MTVKRLVFGLFSTSEIVTNHRSMISWSTRVKVWTPTRSAYPRIVRWGRLCAVSSHSLIMYTLRILPPRVTRSGRWNRDSHFGSRYNILLVLVFSGLYGILSFLGLPICLPSSATHFKAKKKPSAWLILNHSELSLSTRYTWLNQGQYSRRADKIWTRQHEGDYGHSPYDNTSPNKASAKYIPTRHRQN